MKASDKQAGSWVITCLATGMCWEVFSRDDAKKAEEVCLVETASEYLARINEQELEQ